MTLVGTSLGARLIFACLEEIARRHELWEEQVGCFRPRAFLLLLRNRGSRFQPFSHFRLPAYFLVRFPRNVWLTQFAPETKKKKHKWRTSC